MSDKIIKATQVKLVGNPAERPVPQHRAQPVPAGGRVSGQGAEGAARSGDRHGATDHLLDQAKKEAYEKGLADGRALRHKEFVQLLGTMTEATRQAGELKKRLYQEAEGQILQLAIAVAEKVIHTEVGTNRNIVLDVLRAAAKNVVDHDNIKIRLNPGDLGYLVEMKQELSQEVGWLKDAAFEGDPSIKPGGVLLETTSGEIDARLDQQLAEIQKSFRKR